MMKEFRYTALDAHGAHRSGMAQAADESTARADLSRQGLMIETIVENIVTPVDQTAPEVDRRGVDIGSLQLFFSQLASMNKSGVPLFQALSTLHDSSSSPALKQAIGEMRDGANSGKPISETMRRYPQVFGPLPIALVTAGERGGILERSFDQISGYLMRELRLRNKLSAATFWPKLTLFAMLAIPVVTNLIVGVITNANGGMRFPIVNLLARPWFLIPFVFLLLVWLVFFRFINVVPGWRRGWDRLILSIPYVGPTATMLAMAKFSRAFGALYSAGLPMPQTIGLSAEACGNTYIASQISPAAGWVDGGKGVTEALRRTGALSQVALDMVSTGEVTGSMEPVMETVADQYESEADMRQEKMLKMLPFFLTIAGGILVGYIVITFYTGYANTMNQLDNG